MFPFVYDAVLAPLEGLGLRRWRARLIAEARGRVLDRRLVAAQLQGCLEAGYKFPVRVADWWKGELPDSSFF